MKKPRMESLNISTVRTVVKEEVRNYNPIVGNSLTSPSAVAEIIDSYLGLEDLGVEVFGMITVDTKNQLIGIHTFSIGTLNMALVSARTIAQIALLENARGVFLYHNHPSGDNKPSNEDVEVTIRIKKALALFEIKVIDHIIMAKNDGYYSFKADDRI